MVNNHHGSVVYRQQPKQRDRLHNYFAAQTYQVRGSVGTVGFLTLILVVSDKRM